MRAVPPAGAGSCWVLAVCEARKAGRRGLSSSPCAPGSALQQGLRSARGAVEFGRAPASVRTPLPGSAWLGVFCVQVSLAVGGRQRLPRARREWSTVLLCPPGTLLGLSPCPFVPRGPVNNAGQPAAGGRLWVDQRQQPPKKLGLRECPRLLSSGLGLAQQGEEWADESPDRGSRSKLEAESVCLAHHLGSDLPVQAFRRFSSCLVALLGIWTVSCAQRPPEVSSAQESLSFSDRGARCAWGWPSWLRVREVGGFWFLFCFSLTNAWTLPGTNEMRILENGTEAAV